MLKDFWKGSPKESVEVISERFFKDNAKVISKGVAEALLEEVSEGINERLLKRVKQEISQRYYQRNSPKELSMKFLQKGGHSPTRIQEEVV